MKRRLALLGSVCILCALCVGLLGCSDDVTVVSDSTPSPDAFVAVDGALPDAPVPDAPAPDATLPDAAPDAVLPDSAPQPDALVPLTLVVTAPKRAAMLSGSSTAVAVTGTVTPVASLKTLSVNGTAVTPDSAGAFSHNVTATWGLNVLVIVCTDKANVVTRRVQAFHYAATYRAVTPAAPASMAVPKGTIERLYQKAIDDGDRSSLNDLASVLEKVVNTVDIDALIPTTLASGSYYVPPMGPSVPYTVEKAGKLSYAPFKVSIACRSGGVTVTAKSAQVKLPLKLSVTGYASYTGSITYTDLTVVADVDISKTSSGPLNVSVSKINATAASTNVDLSSPFPLLDPIVIAAVTQAAQTYVVDLLTAEIKKLLAGPIKAFVNGVGFGANPTLPLPAALGGSSLSFYSALNTVAFDPAGGTITQNTAVYGTKGVTDVKLGAISISGAYTPPTTAAHAVETALHYDVLNQVMHAPWFAGLLKRDISKEVNLAAGSLPFPVSSMTVKVEALLPPVLMPGTKGYDLDVGLGDLLVTLKMVLPGAAGDTVEATFYVSVVHGGKISLSSKNEIIVTLAPAPHLLELEIVSLKTTATPAPTAAQVTIVLKLAVAQILPLLGPVNVLKSFPLPGIDLSAIGGKYGVPAGTVLKLKNGKVSQKSNHVVVAGDLE